MNENRRQRRARPKLHTSPLKRRVKAFALINLIAVLGAFLGVSVGAFYINDGYDSASTTGETDRLSMLPYNYIATDTGTTFSLPQTYYYTSDNKEYTANTDDISYNDFYRTNVLNALSINVLNGIYQYYITPTAENGWGQIGNLYLKPLNENSYIKITYISVEANSSGYFKATATTPSGQYLIYNSIEPEKGTGAIDFYVEFSEENKNTALNVYGKNIETTEAWLNYAKLRGRLEERTYNILNAIIGTGATPTEIYTSSNNSIFLHSEEKYTGTSSCNYIITLPKRGIYQEQTQGNVKAAFTFKGYDEVVQTNILSTPSNYNTIKIYNPPYTKINISSYITYYTYSETIDLTTPNEEMSVSLKTITVNKEYNNSDQQQQLLLLFPTITDIMNAMRSEYGTTDISSSKPLLYIKEISTIITFETTTEKLQDLEFEISIPTTKSKAGLYNWLEQEGATTYATNINQEIVDISEYSFIGWLTNTVDGFLDTELFLNVSIGDILWSIIGLGLLFAFLKYFAGG